MANINNEENSLYVITYKELLFTFIVFSSILFVLYPKELLKEQILSEKSNYDLSMLYLENLLAQSPEDESLMLILAEQSLRSGKKDLSLRLLKLLFKSKNRDYRERALLLSYELKKDDYFYIKEEHKRNITKKELEEIFVHIVKQKIYKQEDMQKWYKESLFLGNQQIIHDFLNQFLDKNNKDVALLEKLYYLELELKHKEHALYRLHQLQKYDINRTNKWIWDEYYTYVNSKEYNKAEQLLQANISISRIFKIKLAELYLMQKKYKKASNVYDEIYNSISNKKTKKIYFYKLVEALEAGSYFKESAEKVYQYENNYIDDRKVRKFMLEVYVRTGYLNYAANLAKKILNKEIK
jgi:hypothetical protein